MLIYVYAFLPSLISIYELRTVIEKVIFGHHHRVFIYPWTPEKKKRFELSVSKARSYILVVTPSHPAEIQKKKLEMESKD